MIPRKIRRPVLPGAILALKDTPQKSMNMTGGKTSARVRGPSKLRRAVLATDSKSGKKTRYESVSDAARALNCAGSSVANACHRAGRTVKGHILMYEKPKPEDVETYQSDLARIAGRKQGAACANSRKVYSIDPDTECVKHYPSIAAAARAVGCTSGSIHQALHHSGQKKVKGLFWLSDATV